MFWSRAFFHRSGLWRKSAFLRWTIRACGLATRDCLVPINPAQESNIRAVPAVQFLFNAVAFGPKGQMTSVARTATAQQKQNLLQKQVLSYGRTRKMER